MELTIIKNRFVLISLVVLLEAIIKVYFWLDIDSIHALQDRRRVL